MQKLIKRILSSKYLLFLAIVSTLVISYLSLSDISSLPKLEVQFEDKWYHLVAYFALNSVWLLAISSYKSRFARFDALLSVGIIGFGIVIEVFQELITDYRVFDFYDIIANSTGVIVSYLTYQLLKKRILENINTN
ncbi:VanZ family protein [Psychroflexus tropicus]|uniref:VanZ family protein n=1 Tax=Psychroflexus tropicus TaxID=197345 RepID=UPI0006846A5A|nr:VanZ family protein [Psychroflexus tropicus]